MRDRLHFFGNYEYEPRPQTTIAEHVVPGVQHRRWRARRSTKLATLRLDYQFSPAQSPDGEGQHGHAIWCRSRRSAANHPASAGDAQRVDQQPGRRSSRRCWRNARERGQGRPVGFKFKEANLTTWSNHPLKDRGITNGHPRIQFTGFNITGNNNWPRYWFQDIWTLRDDFTFSYNARGRHDVKAGGEFLWAGMTSANCTSCMGNIDARGAPAGLPNRRRDS